MTNELIEFTQDEIKTSLLIPDEFKKNPKDVIIAIDFAKKQNKTLGATLVAFDFAIKFNQSPLTILQNMYEIQGKISWNADFLLSLLKKLYKKIDFVWDDTIKDNPAVKMIAENDEGETFETEMLYYKSWKRESFPTWISIPRTMLKRRAITLFARTNNPEIFASQYDISEMEEIQGKAEVVDVTPAKKEIVEPATKKEVKNVVMNKKEYI